MDKIKLQDFLIFFNQSVHPPSENDSECTQFTAINLHGISMTFKTGGHFIYKWTMGKEDFEKIEKELKDAIRKDISYKKHNRRILMFTGEDFFEIEELPDEELLSLTEGED
ncbi:MAG: hypothetical protein PVH61_13980 [Candidatus Aminicenantes bacterium]|jgi:hypothetical protein